MSLYSTSTGGTNTESFIQRQKRLNQSGTQQGTFAPNTSGTQSPVTATGGTNMQATTQQPAAAGDSVPGATTGPQPIPTTSSMTPQQAVSAGLAWVPQSHPNYGKPGFVGSTPSAGVPQAVATGAQPNPALYSPYGPYPGRPAATNLQGVNLGNSQFATYTPEENATQHQATQFAQWQNMDQQNANASQMALVNAILKNPHSLSADVVSQMKGQQQDQALLMAQQAKNAALTDRAGRGMQGGGAASRLIDNDTISQLLGGYRDIDIQKALTDREDELNALGASEDILTGQLGRGSEQFRNALTGQSAQAEENRFGSQFGLDRDRFLSDERAREYESVRSGQDAELDRLLKQFGINTQVTQSAQDNYGADVDAFFRNKELGLDEKNLALQEKLGVGGLNIDRDKLREGARQFDLGHALDALGFLEGKRQANNDLGFRYNQLDQQGNQSLFDFLSRSLR